MRTKIVQLALGNGSDPRSIKGLGSDGNIYYQAYIEKSQMNGPERYRWKLLPVEPGDLNKAPSKKKEPTR